MDSIEVLSSVTIVLFGWVDTRSVVWVDFEENEADFVDGIGSDSSDSADGKSGGDDESGCVDRKKKYRQILARSKANRDKTSTAIATAA